MADALEDVLAACPESGALSDYFASLPLETLARYWPACMAESLSVEWRLLPEGLIGNILRASLVVSRRLNGVNMADQQPTPVVRMARPFKPTHDMRGITPAKKHHRIYVAGPYTSPSRFGVEMNIHDAVAIAAKCMELGHDAHCPHAATDPIEVMNKRYGGERITYEDYMRLDLGLIEHWATALFYIRPSPGADRELAAAQAKGLVIFRDISEVPNVRQGARA